MCAKTADEESFSGEAGRFGGDPARIGAGGGGIACESVRTEESDRIALGRVMASGSDVSVRAGDRGGGIVVLGDTILVPS